MIRRRMNKKSNLHQKSSVVVLGSRLCAKVFFLFLLFLVVVVVCLIKMKIIRSNCMDRENEWKKLCFNKHFFIFYVYAHLNIYVGILKANKVSGSGGKEITRKTTNRPYKDSEIARRDVSSEDCEVKKRFS